MQSLSRPFLFRLARPAIVASLALTAWVGLVSLTGPAFAQAQEWCHAPTEVLPSLQAQSEQIAEAKKNACGAADQQRKAQSDAKSHNPLAGSDSVIGGQIKMPKGAL